MKTTVTGHNQITIPAKWAKRFSLKPGACFEWRVGSAQDEIICRILPDALQLASELRGAGKKYLKAAVCHPLRALEDDRAAEV